MRAGAEYRDRVHRAAAHPQQSGRVDFQLHNQELSEPVPVRRVVRQQVYVIARGGYDRCDIGGFDPGVPFFRFTPLGLAMRAAARNPVSSRLVGIRVGRMSAFGWGLAAAIGAVAGMMAAPLVYLDPDMMSGIQEINDRTNDSSLVTFQAPLHQVFKGNPVKA